MNRGLDVPAPARAAEHVVHQRREARVVGIEHRLRRLGRVDMDRRIEFFGAFQDRPEEFVVEIAAAHMAADDRADKAAAADAALQLRRGLVRDHRRQRGKAGEALGIFLHRRRERVIAFARQRHCLGSVELFGTGRGERQHLHVDAGGIHRRDPFVADVAQRLDELGAAALEFERGVFEVLPRAVEKQRRGEVFFQRDRAHRAFPVFLKR